MDPSAHKTWLFQNKPLPFNEKSSNIAKILQKKIKILPETLRYKPEIIIKVSRDRTYVHRAKKVSTITKRIGLQMMHGVYQCY